MSALACAPQPRNGSEQTGGVRHARSGEDLLDRPGFHDLPGVHHDDATRDLGDDTEVVGDEDDGHPELSLELGHEVENLRLDCDVEGRRRFVRDEEPRTAR